MTLHRPKKWFTQEVTTSPRSGRDYILRSITGLAQRYDSQRKECDKAQQWSD
jgi:hypothetical protein